MISSVSNSALERVIYRKLIESGTPVRVPVTVAPVVATGEWIQEGDTQWGMYSDSGFLGTVTLLDSGKYAAFDAEQNPKGVYDTLEEAQGKV